MVRIGTVLAVPSVLMDLGASPVKVLAQAGLDFALFDNPDNQISYRARGRLLQRCAQATGCPHFGLLIGQRAGLSSLGLVGLLVKYSPDVGTALRQLVRFLHLQVRGADATLSVEGEYAHLAYRIYQPGVEGNDQTGDGSVAVMLNIMSELCGPDFKVTEARFGRPRPHNAEPYRKFFKARLRFDAPDNALVFSSRWLARPLPDVEPQLRQLLQDHIDALEARYGEDFPEQARRLLRAGLATGHATANRLAGLFAMHVRTLHRRLEEHGTSYRHLLDEVRFEVAQQLLQHSGKNVAEIAGLLDFSDARSFIRAFRRWSGTTPARWRNQAAANGGRRATSGA